MQRTQISLMPEDRRLLDAASARTGRSIAALIRDAVTTVNGASESAEEDLRVFDESRGAWADHDVDEETSVERLRSRRRLDELR